MLKLSVKKKIELDGFFFVLPTFVYFIVLYWYPLLSAFNSSFKEVLPGLETRYVGLKIYSEVFAESLFWKSFINTLYFSIISVAISIILALVIGISLHNLASKRVRNVMTLFFIIPTLVSFAAAGFIWEWLYHPRFGFFNEFLSWFGLPTFGFLTSETEVIPSLAMINVWVRLGFGVLIILSGLQSIPQDFFDAAKVDGATGFRLYWHITLPLLIPQIAVVSLLEVIYAVKVFDIVYVTTKGGPVQASEVLMTYLYNNAFQFYRYDKASVVAVFIFLILLVFGLIQRKLIKPMRYEY